MLLIAFSTNQVIYSVQKKRRINPNFQDSQPIYLNNGDNGIPEFPLGNSIFNNWEIVGAISQTETGSTDEPALILFPKKINGT